MPLDAEEFQEQLFEDVGLMKDAINLQTEAMRILSDRQAETLAVAREVLKEVTKPVEGDSLYTVLRDMAAGIDRNGDLLRQILGRLPQRA
jgi:hypothetical protein